MRERGESTEIDTKKLYTGIFSESGCKFHALVVSSKECVLGFIFSFLVMLERELRALHMLSRCSAAEPHTHPWVVGFRESVSMQQVGLDLIL